MAKKSFNVTTTLREALPRSKRRRNTSQPTHTAVAAGTSVATVSTSSHSHDNKAVLDAQSMDDDGYLYLRRRPEGAENSTIDKVKAGYADKAAHATEAEHAEKADYAEYAQEAANAARWQGRYFDDHIDQPVRKSDTVEHKAIITSSLHSPGQFTDGLLGNGYRLWTDENGTVQLTLDRLTVRQSMVVLELLIERIRSVGGQIVVSAANGKIKTVEETEGCYRITFEQSNRFVAHDLIRCQAFAHGMMKSYWVEVLEADGDAVLVPIDEFAGTPPQPGDECVLMGNTADSTRQNMVLISATEDNQPRIDVMNGIKAKTLDGCLRARFGNLDGISDTRFPSDRQPQGDGLYCDNAYLRGTFLLSTGEDVKTRLEATEGKIETAVSSLRNDLTEENSHLSNAAFADGLDKWTHENDAVFFLAGNRWIWTGDNLLSHKGDGVTVISDNARKVVRIRNKYITQKLENMRNLPPLHTNTDGLKEPVAVYLSFFYRCLAPGTLTIAFDNTDDTGFIDYDHFTVSQDLEATDTYRQFTASGLWNATGDFSLAFSGEIHICMLVLSTDRIETLTHTYKTLFEQSDRLVKISAAVYDRDQNALKETGLIVKPEGAGIYAQDADGNVALIGVSIDETDDQGNKTGSTVKLTADNILLEGLVTANENFKILHDGSIETRNAKLSGYLYTTFRPLGTSDAEYIGDNEYKLNTNLCVDATFNGVVLPVAPEYEGARVMVADTYFTKTRSTHPATTIRAADQSNILSGIFHDLDNGSADIIAIDAGTAEFSLLNISHRDEETGEITSQHLQWVMIACTCKNLWWKNSKGTFAWKSNQYGTDYIPPELT